MYNKEAHLPNSVIGAGSSVSSSPMCNMMTPNMQGNAGGYADLGMLVGGDGGMGGDESVDELQARVYELESKLATLSESYELVCNQTLNCRKELSTYNNVITHMVTLIATMAQKMPAGSGRDELERQLSKLAQVTLEATEFSSMVSAPLPASDITAALTLLTPPIGNLADSSRVQSVREGKRSARK
ncbi:hypothetical protein BC830DRAFT_434480 [Chytriomyces sp. MP71]|nr:hypothetical protein BC830DRAFT_434480 [Chytriomyces sp. MP71]